MLSICSALFVLPTLAFAASLTITVTPNNILPNPATLPPSTHAVLQSTALDAAPVYSRLPISSQNAFEFTNLTTGSYLLNIWAHTFEFEPLRVEVLGDAAGIAEARGEGRSGMKRVEVYSTARGTVWGEGGYKKGEGRGIARVEVQPQGAKEFYVARGGFDPLSMLKNPMVLIAGFSMLVMFGMPKLVENMDEETKKEFEEMQKNSKVNQAVNPANSLQNFDLAGWMAGSSKQSGSDSTGSKKR